MDAALQGKVNLLGALFLAFTLLAVPLFSQVKADTRESVKQAPDTLLSQWAREVSQNFQPDKPTQVEDAWGDQAREENPNCGAECDPDGDLDGDGVSNKEELERGTNPACNEDEYGEETCRQQDPYNVTDPDDENVTTPFRKQLIVVNWSLDADGPKVYPFDTEGIEYDMLWFYLNATYGSSGYQVDIFDPEDALIWNEENDQPSYIDEPRDEDPKSGNWSNPIDGQYTIELSSNGGVSVFGTDSTVDLVVYGVVN